MQSKLRWQTAAQRISEQKDVKKDNKCSEVIYLVAVSLNLKKKKRNTLTESLLCCCLLYLCSNKLWRPSKYCTKQELVLPKICPTQLLSG